MIWSHVQCMGAQCTVGVLAAMLMPRCPLRAAGDASAAPLQIEHGMTQWRKGNPAKNRTPADVVSFARTNPY